MQSFRHSPIVTHIFARRFIGTVPCTRSGLLPERYRYVGITQSFPDSQVANGVLIPFVLIFMLKLVNRESLMGEMRNGATANVIAVSTTVTMIVLTVMMWSINRWLRWFSP